MRFNKLEAAEDACEDSGKVDMNGRDLVESTDILLVHFCRNGGFARKDFSSRQSEEGVPDFGFSPNTSTFLPNSFGYFPLTLTTLDKE